MYGWSCFSFWTLKHLGVGIGSLLLSEGGHNVHKAPVVLDATLSTASLLLLLLLLVNLENAREEAFCQDHDVLFMCMHLND